MTSFIISLWKFFLLTKYRRRLRFFLALFCRSPTHFIKFCRQSTFYIKRYDKNYHYLIWKIKTRHSSVLLLTWLVNELIRLLQDLHQLQSEKINEHMLKQKNIFLISLMTTMTILLPTLKIKNKMAFQLPLNMALKQQNTWPYLQTTLI